MKYLFALLAASFALPAQISGVHSVYILPMAGGLDQYLAQELAQKHVIGVVADPKAADAVLADRLGGPFEQKMSEIYPPAPAAKSDSATEQSMNEHPAFHSSQMRGTIFLVDAKTRKVIWSDYEKPHAPSDASLHREARRIAKKLEAEAAPPRAASQ